LELATSDFVTTHQGNTTPQPNRLVYSTTALDSNNHTVQK